eukprot:5373419-Alexandrium_andersonii.AAC.1
MPSRNSREYATDPGDLPELWGAAPVGWDLQRAYNVEHRCRKACLVLRPDKRRGAGCGQGWCGQDVRRPPAREGRRGHVLRGHEGGH